MALRMVRSMQLALGIDAPEGRISSHSNDSGSVRSQRCETRSFDSRRPRTHLRSQQTPTSCGDCGGPLVAGEGQVVCVVCGLTRAA